MDVLHVGLILIGMLFALLSAGLWVALALFAIALGGLGVLARRRVAT